MSDGHLFLGDDGVAFAGSVGSFWHDEGHGSVLALAAPPSRQLLEIPLGPEGRAAPPRRAEPPSIARSKSAPALAFEADDAAPPRPQSGASPFVLFDFVAASVDTTGVLLMRVSLDRQFVAIQRSDVEVQIVRLATRESYWIVCKAKPGNRILSEGVLWNTHSASPQSSQDLFLVTRLGIEQYRVSPKRRSCALHRTIAVHIHSFWYSAAHCVLIVSTGSRANEIVPFLMQGASVEKLPRLVFSSAVRKRDLFLASLYGNLYAVYGDSKTTRLLLYRVTRQKVSCVRSLHLMLPAGSPLEFSVVDNLLVCHSVEFSVSLFFDIKCDINTHDPFSHPLPVSLAPPASHVRAQTMHKAASFVDPRRNGADDIFQAIRPSTDEIDRVPMNHHDQSTRDADKDAVSPWRFLSPNFAQRSITSSDPHSKFTDRIEIRRFHLNLEHVSRSCAQHPEILPFLLRRGEQAVAKRLVLGLVRERLEEQALPPAAAAALLACVQTVSAQDIERFGVGRTAHGSTSDESGNDTSSDDELRSSFSARAVMPLALSKRFFRDNSGDSFSMGMVQVPSRNLSGLTMIFQSEFLEHLWQPLLDNPAVAKTASLSSYMLEFVRLLHQQSVPVETHTYMALAKAFLRARTTGQLYQVLQYQVLSDSTELADLLLESSKIDVSLRQLALDMYTRIGATTSVIQILLANGEVDEAIVVAWRYLKTGTGDPSVISGLTFFEAWVRSCSTREQTTAMATQQRLHSLLLFLRMWDGECLLGEPSILAQHVSVPFPDRLLPESTRRRWRQSFGFPST